MANVIKKEDTSGGLFVQCKYPRKIVHMDDPSITFTLPKDYIGSVPGWVTKHPYFEALCKDGTVTTVVNTKDTALEAAQAAAAKAEETARLTQEMNVKIKEAQDAARLVAEGEAAAQGLDQNARKKLIAKKEAEAKAAVEAEYEVK